tara:strand:+ start:53 stop:895 length:843 start_codon:yes stop_codon:yes gene_type:complete
MDHSIEVIDIKNGFFVNAGKNLFQTGIQSALIKYKDGQEQEAYLCTECRSETVYDHGGFSHHIFKPNAYAGKGGFIHTWKGPGFSRTGSTNCIRWLKQKPNFSLCKVNPDCTLEFQRHTPLVQATVVCFEDLLHLMRDLPSQKNMNIYMKVDYAIDDCEYSIVCPCKYINFRKPGSGMCDSEFLQTISGDVLVETEENFWSGYIAVRIVEDELTVAQFALKTSVHIVDVAIKEKLGKKIGWLLGLFKVWPLNGLLQTDEYSKIVNLDTEFVKCTFFKYNN